MKNYVFKWNITTLPNTFIFDLHYIKDAERVEAKTDHKLIMIAHKIINLSKDTLIHIMITSFTYQVNSKTYDKSIVLKQL